MPSDAVEVMVGEDRLEVRRVSSRVFEVYSVGSDSFYRVWEDKGRWFCTCPFSTLHPGSPKWCKHIRAVMKFLGTR